MSGQISTERLSALVGFVYQGIKQLTPEDRVLFLQGLDSLFCKDCGYDQPAARCCQCSNDE